MLFCSHLIYFLQDVKDRILGESDALAAAKQEVADVATDDDALFDTVEVVADDERYLIQAGRLPWFAKALGKESDRMEDKVRHLKNP